MEVDPQLEVASEGVRADIVSSFRIVWGHFGRYLLWLAGWTAGILLLLVLLGWNQFNYGEDPEFRLTYDDVLILALVMLTINGFEHIGFYDKAERRFTAWTSWGWLAVVAILFMVTFTWGVRPTNLPLWQHWMFTIALLIVTIGWSSCFWARSAMEARFYELSRVKRAKKSQRKSDEELAEAANS